MQKGGRKLYLQKHKSKRPESVIEWMQTETDRITYFANHAISPTCLAFLKT